MRQSYVLASMRKARSGPLALLPELCRRRAVGSLERPVERSFGVIADVESDLGHAAFRRSELLGSQLKPPVGEIRNRGDAQEMPEPLAQARARHSDAPREILNRPGVRRILMHQRKRLSNYRVA